MSLKEKVIEVLRQPCPIEVGEATVGFYQMPEDEADAIYERLVDAGLLVSDEPKYGEFAPVTEHYGFIRERDTGRDVFCVYRADEPVKDLRHICFGSFDRSRVERECQYLEDMNFGDGKE